VLINDKMDQIRIRIAEVVRFDNRDDELGYSKIQKIRLLKNKTFKKMYY
jgi:hypothetical protein